MNAPMADGLVDELEKAHCALQRITTAQMLMYEVVMSHTQCLHWRS